MKANLFNVSIRAKILVLNGNVVDCVESALEATEPRDAFGYLPNGVVFQEFELVQENQEVTLSVSPSES